MVSGILKRFSQRMGSEEEVNVDEYLDTLGLENEDIMEEQADMWVKPFLLQDISDIAQVTKEINDGNQVILNIEPLYKRNATKVKQAVSELKGLARTVDGDIVRITEFKLLVTPRGVKVAKPKKTQATE